MVEHPRVRQPLEGRAVSEELGGTERILRQQADRLDDEARTAEDLRIINVMRAVVREEVRILAPTEEEREWVRQAMKSQAKRVQFWGAVFEKTAAGIVWAGVAGVGYAIVEYVRLKLGMRQ